MTMGANKKNSFNVILEDGQMKRVDPDTYQTWKEEKKDQFATSIVQPKSGHQFGVYFMGDEFKMLCEDPQVWNLVIGDMTIEDYRKLKEKHPEVSGIDDMIASFSQSHEDESEIEDKDWEDLEVGDFVDIEGTFHETFATQSELLKYLQQNYINSGTEKAYFIGTELPFKY